MEESEDSNAGYGQLIYLIKIKQTNKNYPVGEKQAGWLAGKAGLDKAGQSWTRLDTDDIKHKVTNPHGTANTRRL